MIVTGSSSTQPNMLQRVCHEALEKVEQMGEQVASCPLGQIVFRGVDRVLWTAESTVKWFSEEAKEPKQNGSSPACVKTPADKDQDEDDDHELVRPLPWILFLPLLFWLRIAKVGIELVASLRGKEPLRPSQVVQFIQVQRRHLRALKYQGLKNFKSWQRLEHQRRQPNDDLDESLSSDENEVETQVTTVPTDISSDENHQGALGPSAEQSLQATSTNQPNNIHQVANSQDCQNQQPIPSVVSEKSPANGEDATIATIGNNPTDETHRDVVQSSIVRNNGPRSETVEDDKSEQNAQKPANQQIEGRTDIGNNKPSDDNSKPDAIVATTTAVDIAKEENEDVDDSSSTVSLESAEAGSESNSQIFYSPILTPEPQTQTSFHSQPASPVWSQGQDIESQAFYDQAVTAREEELLKVQPTELRNNVQNSIKLFSEEPLEEINKNQMNNIGKPQIPADNNVSILSDSMSSKKATDVLDQKILPIKFA